MNRHGQLPSTTSPNSLLTLMPCPAPLPQLEKPCRANLSPLLPPFRTRARTACPGLFLRGNWEGMAEGVGEAHWALRLAPSWGVG